MQQARKELKRADRLKRGDVICVGSGKAVIKNVFETDYGIRIIYVTKQSGGRRDVPRDKMGTVYNATSYETRKFIDDVFRARGE